MIERCREDFPTLQGDNPAYLDNACVTLKPKSVIDAITDYYTQTRLWRALRSQVRHEGIKDSGRCKEEIGCLPQRRANK